MGEENGEGKEPTIRFWGADPFSRPSSADRSMKMRIAEKQGAIESEGAAFPQPWRSYTPSLLLLAAEKLVAAQTLFCGVASPQT